MKITGLKKLGAIVCDSAQLGVNAVTMPGTIIKENLYLFSRP